MMNTGQNTPFAQEADQGLGNELPAYATMLDAFHRACRSALRQIVETLPISRGMRVLDMACGDGLYTGWFAELTGAEGKVAGVDLSPAYLAVARERLATELSAGHVTLQQGTIDDLPFSDGSFDLVWCAHSLYSLPDPVAALHALKRVTKPGGTLAILENDTLHQMLLPLPPTLELSLRQAQLVALERERGATGRFYAGRQLGRLLRQVGLEHTMMQTRTIDHGTPLTPDEYTYLQGYLDDLWQRALPDLDDETAIAGRMFFEPSSPAYLLDQPDFFASHLEILACGTRPPEVAPPQTASS